MKEIKINLKNCYGIKKLQENFDFSECGTVVVYAPNGVMKTSFAKTFSDFSNGKESSDQRDDTLETVSSLKDEHGVDVDASVISVIDSYDEKAFNSEDKVLTLLADEEARSKYFEIYREIESLKKATLPELRQVSKSSNYEAEIIEAFAALNKDNIYEILESIMPQIKSSQDIFNFAYNDVFDTSGKVRAFLDKHSDLLDEYIVKYEELTSNSDFFKAKTFGTSQAKAIDGALEGDGFFKAGHKIILKGTGEIAGHDEYNDSYNKEMDRVFEDDSLRKIFNKIEKALEANKELRAFKLVIENDNSILVRLKNYDDFKCDAWFSFLKKIESGVASLLRVFNTNKSELKRITQESIDSESEWESAITEFHNRFVDIPFELKVENKADAVLHQVVPAISFQFEGSKIERNDMITNILSQGERRAFYLLNIIFEIKTRQLQSKETLYVIDDIADSFDYKNKYAIVEYLNDIFKESTSHSIILTHNFDFFRTIQSRILGERFKRSHSFVAQKNENGVKLLGAGGRCDTEPFKYWKRNINKDEKCLLACIPFVRNLIEYNIDSNDDAYHVLTHVLHTKEADTTRKIKASEDITIDDIEAIYSKVLSGINFEFEDKTKKISDIMNSVIQEIIRQPNYDSIALEDKVIISIGARVKAEKYIWGQISNQNPISTSQTGKLIDRYKDEYKHDANHLEAIKVLERVSIMTPANIHLNSFMYEPILDMGINELISLYKEVDAMKSI